MTDARFGETLEYLYQQLPMFQREGGSAVKKDLTNTRELCWVLGLPQWKIKTVHIAGTNGKGSTSSMLASILQEAGLKVGLYTSPHLMSFTERIKINGEEISQRKVVSFVDQLRPFIERIRPSFFELTVAMAFSHFDKEEVDIAVIETGMGGRLDSTNVLRPEICAITNISFDHQQFLGDTLELIAGEKAGIIKPYTPVIIGEKHPETSLVFEAKATQEEAELIFAEDRFEVRHLSGSWEGQVLELYDKQLEESSVWTLDLPGTYQSANLRTVMSIILRLIEDDWDIEEEHIRAGLSRVRENVGLRGRMECLGQEPLMLCDVGHNEAGIHYILEQLKSVKPENLHIVWGMVSDKDHHKILKLLPQEASYYWTRPSVPRGLPADQLEAKALEAGLPGKRVDSVAEAIREARTAADPDQVIFIGGSTFTVADALTFLSDAELQNSQPATKTGS